MLKNQDILVLAALIGNKSERLSFARIADKAKLSVSESFAAVNRLMESSLINSERRIIRNRALEFLTHSLRYICPASYGNGTATGMPAAYAAPVAAVLEHTELSKAQQKERADQLMEEFGLTRLEKSYASYLSGGERRRLEIARCLIREPLFVLLDEPFAGIDPIAVGDIQELIRGLKDRGIGVLISDHNVRETLSICDRAYLMFQGNIILSGTSEEIISNERAREVYLGDSFRI